MSEEPRDGGEQAEELTADGPWNQQAMLDARERQVPVSIGGVPATAAMIGEPFLRGSRRVRALLITPTPDAQHDAVAQHDALAQHDAVAQRQAAVPQDAVVQQDPKLPNSQGGISKTTIGATDTAQPPVESEGRSLFAELADDEPPPDELAAADSSGERGRSRNLRVPLLVTAAAFALSVGIPIALHASSPASTKTSAKPPAVAISSSSTPDSALARQRAQLLSWVRSYLPMDSVIVTDQVSRDQLRTAGFSQVLAFGELGDTPLQTVDYVLNVPGASVPQTGTDGRRQLLASSQALAQFGSATAREFFPQPATGISQRKLADAQLRKQGGAELGVNPAVVPDPAVRSVLAAGQLDLRAQNVLNLLASSGTLYVTDPTLVPAEQQLGQPVRSIVITTDGTTATQNVLASMISPYKPDSIVQLSQRKLRLTWSPAIAPVATVGQ